MHRASRALRMLPSSTITVGTSAALSVPRSRRTSSPSPPYAVETGKPAPTSPARTRSASRRDGPAMSSVQPPAQPGPDDEEAARRGRGAVAVQRDLEVGSDLRAEPAAGTDARPPVGEAVGGAGHPDRRTERLEPSRQRPGHPPGEGGLGEPAVGRRAGRVARLPQPHPDLPVDLARVPAVAELVPRVDRDGAAGQRQRLRPGPAVRPGRPPAAAARRAGRPPGAARRISPGSLSCRQPWTLSVRCGMLADMPASPPHRGRPRGHRPQGLRLCRRLARLVPQRADARGCAGGSR